jgi:hypothetical protein
MLLIWYGASAAAAVVIVNAGNIGQGLRDLTFTPRLGLVEPRDLSFAPREGLREIRDFKETP